MKQRKFLIKSALGGWRVFYFLEPKKGTTSEREEAHAWTENEIKGDSLTMYGLKCGWLRLVFVG